MQLNRRQPAEEAASTDVAAAAAGTTWTDLIGFWTGRLGGNSPSMAVFAEASRATEQALRISQTMFAANRMVANSVYNAARHQQKQALTAASAALATITDIPGDAARQAATESLRQLAIVCTEACSRNREAAWSLMGTMLGAKPQPTT